jgi:hypothetical protein
VTAARLATRLDDSAAARLAAAAATEEALAAAAESAELERTLPSEREFSIELISAGIPLMRLRIPGGRRSSRPERTESGNPVLIELDYSTVREKKG